ncbi:hypothetical protein M758_1G102600 [Ceratodon purpureus]|uniref:HMA domain-containing protein n=1 Tax=Ceratodon purpureus TaxID=3225 RepID=A0A8T0J3X3_CERPU|nr:hypothetical protein KC19_1G113800 [Ceratodon purpureus]KAG0629423.1 hypothetical protein M758_1G102600 [Ceratodon purpureus]
MPSFINNASPPAFTDTPFTDTPFLKFSGTRASICFIMFSFPKANEFFYGNMEPTWITRTEDELHYPFNRYMVPVVEFDVPQCCTTNCEIKIKNRLYNIPGVNQVIVDFYNQKVTVTGNAKGEKILRELKKVKKRAKLYVRKQDGQL